MTEGSSYFIRLWDGGFFKGERRRLTMAQCLVLYGLGLGVIPLGPLMPATYLVRPRGVGMIQVGYRYDTGMIQGAGIT